MLEVACLLKGQVDSFIVVIEPIFMAALDCIMHVTKFFYFCISGSAPEDNQEVEITLGFIKAPYRQTAAKIKSQDRVDIKNGLQPIKYIGNLWLNYFKVWEV